MRKWTISATIFILPVLALGAYKQKLPASSAASTAGSGGVALSSGSGSFSTSSGAYTAVTNMSVTLTTTGRPVFIGMIPDGAFTQSGVSITQTSASSFTATGSQEFLRGATVTGVHQVNSSLNASNTGGGYGLPCSSLSTIDFPAAGTYTYSAKVALTSGSSFSVSNCKLVAYEL